MSEYNADKLLQSNSKAEFTAISPLEPLDPNKFRNIMLDKQEINTQQNQNRDVHAQQSSSTSEYHPSNPVQTAEVQDVKKYQIQNPQQFSHHQNLESNPFMQHHQPPQPVQQPNLQQQAIHQNPQQYYPHPQSAMQFPQQYGMQFAGGMQSPAAAQAKMPVMSPMVAPTHAHPHPQQQPSHSNYPVHGQQQWIHHQAQANPQFYHNAMQGRLCSPQQHPLIKQMPPPPYAMTPDPANPHQMNPFAHQHQAAPTHIVQRQISQEFNYPMAQQSQQNVQYGPPGFVAYGGYGGMDGGHVQNNFQNQPNLVLQQPSQIKKAITPSDQPRPPPHQIHHNIAQPRPHMLRMPAMPIAIHQPPQYIGHEPAIAATLNPDVCLAGCVFLLIGDCNSQLVDNSLLPSLIRFYGGDVESPNPRGISERVTHVICSSWLDNEQIIQQALSPGFVDRIPRKMKRIVTVNWLNTAIEKRRVDPPTNPSHLPSFWSVLRQNQQNTSKTISIFGFSPQDSNVLKYMIETTGAKFGPITARTNFLVLNRSERSEEIIQKAREQNIQLVNFQWLFELYFGNVNVLSTMDLQRYSWENDNAQISMFPQYLAKTSEFCHKLMLPWTQPIMLNDEILKGAYELKKNVANDTNIFAEKLYSISNNAPTEEQIKQASSLIAAYNGTKEKISVLIEGLFPAQIENLSKKVRFLCGKIAENVAECTHFVTPNLRKSVNLIQAIAQGKNIVNPLWVETSFKRLEFLDSLPFFVIDRENERKMGYSLKNTILRTRNRRIFQDVHFHISDSVQPSYAMIKAIVESAGGTVEEERPKKRQLLQCIQENKTYFIVCNRNDLNIFQYLVNCNFPLFNEDFLIMSILRHKIDLTHLPFHAYPSNALPSPANGNNKQR